MVQLWRIHRHIGMGGDQLVASLIGEEADEEHGDGIRDAEKQAYMALIDEVAPLEGARELIVELKEREHTVVLASSAKADEVDHYVDLLVVRDLVDGWTTSADVEQTKPEPDLVVAALEKGGGGDGVMVGDSTWDCEAAKRANIPSIGSAHRRLQPRGAARSGRRRRSTNRSPRCVAGLLTLRYADPPGVGRVRGNCPHGEAWRSREARGTRPQARARRKTAACSIRYHRHGDQSAREELVQRLLPLARRMARRYRRSDEPLDDLIQVATLGLIKAIDRFDPARETAFSSYAVPTMLGELKRYFRDNGWAVHVPRGMQERVMQVDNCVKDMSRKLGRSPSAQQVAETLDLSIEQVLEAMEAASAYDAVSLESYRFGDEGDGETYAESIGSEDERFELVEYGATIAPTLQALPPRDRIVLHLRFVEDLTQAEIAERVGVSQMHVSRLIRRALERLRTVAEHAG